ncbi:MAG: hypothetical protein O2865_14375 [Planctomycetota bacterium]|nr:hypothetical protein [Planctomycetota bacterium]
MHRSAALISFSLLAATLSAQEPLETRDPVSDAWLAFRAEQGPLWEAAWNKATGTPKAIYGQGLRVAPRVDGLAHARELAGDVLAGHAGLLGTGRSTFAEDIGQKVNQLYVFVYQQRYAGLEVLGGRADVRLNENGVVAMFGSKAVQFPADFAVKPSVPADLAWAIGHEHLRVEPRDMAAAADLVVHADPDSRSAVAIPRLAWRVAVDVRNGNDLTVGKVFVDARTGAVIEFRNEVYECGFGHTHVAGEAAEESGAERTPVARGHVGLEIAKRKASTPPVDITGNVRAWMNKGDPLTPRTNEPMQGLRVTAAGVGTAITDVNGDFTIPYSGTAPVTLTVTLGAGGGEFVGGGIQVRQGTLVTGSALATPGVPAQIQLLGPNPGEFDWSQTTTFWYVDDVYRWVSGLTNSIPTNRINIAQIRPAVNIASTCNAYYTGNTINFYATGGTCNMTAFDSVIYHEWGHGVDDAFGGISQTDGLSEGWGDIMSIYRLADPIVGRNFTTSGGIVRNANNTLNYPAGGGVHQQGQTWMGFAWDLRNNLIAALGQAAGAARAEQIVIGTLAANATNQPDAVREVFIMDDDDGNLANGTPNYSSLEAAAVGRNLPYPQVQVGSITHTALSSTSDQLAPQVVRANVVALSGSFTSINLVYDLGAGAQTVSMVATGNGSEHVALIPGVLSPNSVDYHIEAAHSTGLQIRYPNAGEIRYAVGEESVFFVEDFESGGNGWTHAQVRTQDDWQIGTPAGRSGSSGGVAWSDPNTAASGTAVYANDLGAPGWNGAYARNVTNYLRSPVLNLTGAQGVKLAFRRWLTVEKGIYDQATISVNGQQIWVNDANVDHLDTAWTDFEVALPPSVDNNPSVQLEWGLNSDQGIELGGWNIDDVRVLSFQGLPAPVIQATLDPAQVPLGGSTQLSIQGDPLALAAVLISLSQGPTSIPGLPELAVGLDFNALPIGLDASGGYQATLPASNDPATRGVLIYGQVVSMINNAFDVSNKMVLLIGN